MDAAFAVWRNPALWGMVLSRRRTGACEALLWVEEERVYRCGALTEPQHILGDFLPRWMQFAKKPLGCFAAKARAPLDIGRLGV
uniref:Uncharacterized protein n=1 Tax=Curvibacter symbiont subsp. Hydra magnipapillata TaxID=667019 RepID=C9Y878_CURXX|nr:hypothetical protein Csp_A03290 [Curvibacter putative symbiont of Hydra magnipapillata]